MKNIQETLDKCNQILEDFNTVETLLENEDYVLVAEFGIRNYYSVYQKISKNKRLADDSFIILENAISYWYNSIVNE